MAEETPIFGAKSERLDWLVSQVLSEPETEEQDTGTDPASLERIGSWIGRYKLLSVLGEGGMGIVYSAEQERPIRRLVALKVIKPGMDTKQVIARFEVERQALALLDHPHIARVFDAGATDAGRPYFAMECVRGVPITEYCDKNRLGTQERLRLFLPLCQAVQHAHQKGIIHRDLKPSNVLVMLQGDQPVPKIIDFGIAKALNQRLTEKTLYTAKDEFIGTPEYMSPEQADLTGLDIDTRSDIYSLGVLLYELLTGCTPFDPRDLRSKGHAEMQRVIREQDPLRPSAKLTRLGGKLEEIAKRRSTTVLQLRKSLRGDLDWIVMKAMEKDRARRYATVQALGEDIERHLNHHPVSAGSPGVLYRTRKFVRRHRTQALVGGLALAVVIASATLLFNVYTDQKRNARSSLSAARAHYEAGRYAEADKILGGLVNNRFVRAEARLWQARTALAQSGSDLPKEQLEALLREPNEIIVSQAHLLLAQIYLESGADDDETARQLERKANEHLQEGRRLAPHLALTYFNLALLSDAPAERLDLLNQALRLDPGHVDSLRVRALVHQATRNYNRMEIDASVLAALMKNHPEGYALRAIALREKALRLGEKELLSPAVDDHGAAIELAPTQPRFYEERRETYMRVGEYEKALADARKCTELSPEEHAHSFHAFCALTALGRYDEAQEEAAKILAAGSSFRGDRQFREWAAVYAREVVDRHAAWHPVGQEPQGPAFEVLRQTIEAHRNLAQKARCLVPEGQIASWSPNEEELVYGRGFLGYNVIEVLNLKTGATRLLSYSGFDPAWSPDGRYIAFVRNRRVRLQDLERKRTYVPEQQGREIWIVDASGTGKPRLLTRGGYPSWSRDPQRLHYYLHDDGGHLCSIFVDGDNPKPTRRIPALDPFPVVSPDGKYAVWHINDVAELVDLSDGKVLARWIGFFPSWSRDGRLVFSRFDGRHDGVWVCDVEKRKTTRVLEDLMAFRCSWAPNTGQITLSPALTIPHLWGYIYPGMWGSIWISPLSHKVVDAGSSAPLQDWPQDESDPRSLMHMIRGYEIVVPRMEEAKRLRDRLMEILLQAVVSRDPNDIRPVQRLADAYLWFGQYDEAERLYLWARDRQFPMSATAAVSLDLTEELVRLYLDVVNRYDQAGQLCLELWKTRQEVFGADSPRAIRTSILFARACERQKQYAQARQLCLDLLNLPSRTEREENPAEVYESVLSPFLEAPVSHCLDETAFALRTLDNRRAGATGGGRWKTCAHYLLARLYTTCPESEFHNIAKAIEHATAACDEPSGRANPVCLDALAAAYARAGQFDLAVRRQKEAVERLSGTGAHLLTAAYANRLARYERGVATGPQGLVARWEFESSPNRMVPDSSGNNLHGRLVGDARVHTDPERGNVLRLDGTGDWVDCGADRRFDLTDTLTLCAWVRVGRLDKAYQTLVAKGVGAWGLQRDGTRNALQFACTGVGATRAREESRPGSVPAGDLSPGGFPTLRSHPDVNDGRWHHVAGVYDGHRVSLYVDGTLEALTPILDSPPIPTSPDNVLIGTNARIATPCEWNGLVDDLRIYNYALAPEDIQALGEGREPTPDPSQSRER